MCISIILGACIYYSNRYEVSASRILGQWFAIPALVQGRFHINLRALQQIMLKIRYPT